MGTMHSFCQLYLLHLSKEFGMCAFLDVVVIQRCWRSQFWYTVNMKSVSDLLNRGVRGHHHQNIPKPSKTFTS